MAASNGVQVIVRDGWLVVDPATGEQVGGGSTLDLPSELADQWTKAGWVRTTSKPAAKRGK